MVQWLNLNFIDRQSSQLGSDRGHHAESDVALLRQEPEHLAVPGRPVDCDRQRSEEYRGFARCAMNGYLGGFSGQAMGSGDGYGDMKKYTIYLKYSDLSRPGPDRILLFIDEREDAINYGNFLADMRGYSPSDPSKYGLLDLPASYHGRAGGLSFCDGHSEIHRWRDVRTMPPVAPNGQRIFDGSTPTPSADNVDVGWLQDKTTRPIIP